jgi:demethylmenaquinone methyltransferase/2-methoxy-6-polyprenyl-1,4-benzoquinol methylase
LGFAPRYELVPNRHVSGQSLYDWYGEHGQWYALVERAARSLRRATVAALEPDPGDTVLDVGCGPGSNFDLLRERVGPDGRVVGVDYSAGMVRRARRRAADAGWENVAVVRGDAGRLPLSAGAVDGAVATLALSAMPAAGSVTREVARVCRPDAGFAVLDADLSPATAGVLYPLLARLFRRLANWQPDVDVVRAVEAAFAATTEVARYDAGTAVVLLADRPTVPAAGDEPRKDGI